VPHVFDGLRTKTSVRCVFKLTVKQAVYKLHYSGQLSLNDIANTEHVEKDLVRETWIAGFSYSWR